MFYQQGDVIIEKIDRAASDGHKLEHTILAEGEATGHCHAVTEGDVELTEHVGVLYLKVAGESATVTHQEHAPVTIPSGDYVVRKVREFDHFSEEARNVQD
jgi:hypothetical protein